MKNIFALLAILSLGFGCRKSDGLEGRSADLSDVPGIYMGYYCGGRERIELRPNGTFSQKFVRDEKTVYEIDGLWSAEQLDGDLNVNFRPFMNLITEFEGHGGVRKMDWQTGLYDSSARRIWFFKEVNYGVGKVSDPNESQNPTSQRAERMESGR